MTVRTECSDCTACTTITLRGHQEVRHNQMQLALSTVFTPKSTTAACENQLCIKLNVDRRLGIHAYKPNIEHVAASVTNPRYESAVDGLSCLTAANVGKSLVRSSNADAPNSVEEVADP